MYVLAEASGLDVVALQASYGRSYASLALRLAEVMRHQPLLAVLYERGLQSEPPLGMHGQAADGLRASVVARTPGFRVRTQRRPQLTAAREEAEGQLEQRRMDLPTSEEIGGYVADFREFLGNGTFPERKALLRNFVEGIEIVGEEATLTYTIPMPQDGVIQEPASVLDFVQSGPPSWT